MKMWVLGRGSNVGGVLSVAVSEDGVKLKQSS